MAQRKSSKLQLRLRVQLHSKNMFLLHLFTILHLHSHNRRRHRFWTIQTNPQTNPTFELDELSALSAPVRREFGAAKPQASDGAHVAAIGTSAVGFVGALVVGFVGALVVDFVGELFFGFVEASAAGDLAFAAPSSNQKQIGSDAEAAA